MLMDKFNRQWGVDLGGSIDNNVYCSARWFLNNILVCHDKDTVGKNCTNIFLTSISRRKSIV